MHPDRCSFATHRTFFFLIAHTPGGHFHQHVSHAPLLLPASLSQHVRPPRMNYYVGCTISPDKMTIKAEDRGPHSILKSLQVTDTCLQEEGTARVNNVMEDGGLSKGHQSPYEFIGDAF
jgi:hypothetical protein